MQSKTESWISLDRLSHTMCDNKCVKESKIYHPWTGQSSNRNQIQKQLLSYEDVQGHKAYIVWWKEQCVDVVSEALTCLNKLLRIHSHWIEWPGDSGSLNETINFTHQYTFDIHQYAFNSEVFRIVLFVPEFCKIALFTHVTYIIFETMKIEQFLKEINPDLWMIWGD